MKKHLLIFLTALLLPAMAFAQDNPTGFFVEAGSGVNAGFTGAKYESRVFSHVGLGLNANLAVGYWFHPRWGVRAGYQGVNISNTYTEFGSMPLTYLHADALFRLFPALVPYVHLGALGLDKWSFGGGAGVAIPIELSRRISIVPDLRATALSPKAFAESQSGVSVTLSGSIGVIVRLGKVE